MSRGPCKGGLLDRHDVAIRSLFHHGDLQVNIPSHGLPCTLIQVEPMRNTSFLTLWYDIAVFNDDGYLVCYD